MLPLVASFCLGAAGCTWDQLNPFEGSTPPPGPVDSVVLRPGGLEGAQLSTADTNPEMIGAMEKFRQGDYAKAQKTFHRLAEKTKDDANLAEKARFYEAECLFLQQRYPKAADTYVRLLNDFGSGTYRDQAVRRLYDVADYWLDDTREQMREARDVQDGKRWFVTPRFVHLDKTKPLLDREGRALEVLEQVRYNDVGGPLADKALFLAGSVNYFNENYREADYHFSQLAELHPNSTFAPKAMELAIISKHMCTGGSDYDGRKVAEARELVHRALVNCSDPNDEKAQFYQRQLVGITLQQAEKDYKMADFYRRRGQPCPAYFMFEVVRRRYPGTKYADLATEQMHKLKAKVEKENGGRLPVPEASPLRPDTPLEPGTPLYRETPPGELPQPRTLPPELDR
jgi:outer membrane protein assembly factor BamD (BamD/ComL family)